MPAPRRGRGYKTKTASISIMLAVFKVSEMRLELTRSNDHYPLKVARLPIPPSGQVSFHSLVQRFAYIESHV